MSDSGPKDLLPAIAIIGMSGRFPGAADIEEFWNNISNGVESIAPFTREELEKAGVKPSTISDPNFVNAGSVIDGEDLFDASFFGCSPMEAEIMDPQHRLFLECCWQAIEEAGYGLKQHRGVVGVYTGAGLDSYLLYNLYNNQALLNSAGIFQILLGNDKNTLAARVSYKLDLTGPSINVQTSCSTSLVCVCLASQALLDFQCDMALAGGVRISVPQRTGYLYREGGIASPDGHCRAFDWKAQGTVNGNGVGVVLLKRLEDAIADNDYIHAVIRGFAINNDGSAKVGFTAPSAQGQAEVIAMAQEMAELSPETITYIEAHGTGTNLGDPIEIAALNEVFAASTDKRHFCALGSLKTNIGHLDAAAGVAGLIKTVEAIKHRKLPPSLHFEKPNPQIDFDNSPFFVNTQLRDWQAGDGPLRAAVSSFGIGGTNAHLIVEQAPPQEPARAGRASKLLLLSARTETALETMTENLAACLKKSPQLDLADVAYSLQVGRTRLSHRRFLVCRDLDEAVKSLEAGRFTTSQSKSNSADVVFMFSGQGSQYVNMGRGLYETESAFREQVDLCSDILLSHIGIDLRTVLYPIDEALDQAAEKLDQTELTQPALFALEYSLAMLWMKIGIRPSSMIGHSIGEYVAACLAGVFSVEDALRLVSVRGRLMQQLAPGAMLAVALPEKDVIDLIGETLSLAASNAPDMHVVSGSIEAILELEERLARTALSGTRLRTSHAFHSEMMEPMLNQFIGEAEKVRMNAPRIPFVSNLTGRFISASEATSPRYWARHLRERVRFRQGIEELSNGDSKVLLEIGPGQTLVSLAKSSLNGSSDHSVIASMKRKGDQGTDEECFLNAIGRLSMAGCDPDWQNFYESERRRRVPLPATPFDRKRYWIEPQPSAAESSSKQNRLERKPNVTDWFYTLSWKRASATRLADDVKAASEWLILADHSGFGERLAKRFEEEGARVLLVTLGEDYARTGNSSYTIRPDRREDYVALFNDLSLQGRLPTRIAHLSALTSPCTKSIERGSFPDLQSSGFYSLLYLCQALGELNSDLPIKLCVVTDSLYDIIGGEITQPEAATILGPCKVIPKEYPSISTRHIDIRLEESGTKQEAALVEQLIRELTGDAREQVVALRGAHCWVPIFERINVEPCENLPGRLREGGVYLITGGLGGIGLSIAEYLAMRARAKLILTARSSFPEREKWSEWIADHGKQDDVSRKILRLQTLESLGGEVLTIAADVCDESQMKRAIETARSRYGPINGIVHAAGVPASGMIQLKTVEAAESVIAPKARGAMVLASLLEKEDIDFFILCSSHTSFIGHAGRSDYSAANAFLDAFAFYHTSKTGVFTQAINWETWREVGMAKDSAIRLNLDLEEALKISMTTSEGVDTFERALTVDLPFVAVSMIDFQSLVEYSYKKDPPSQALSSSQETIKPAHPRPHLTAEYVRPTTDVETTIAEIWQRLLGIEKIGLHDNFFELGGDSVISIQVISKANQAGLRLTPKQVFQHQTIAELAAVAGTGTAIQAEQGIVTGELPLTPIQRFFFELELPDPNHYNQSVMFEVRDRFDPRLLEKAVAALLDHHDSSRLRFSNDNGVWHQFNSGQLEAVPFAAIDLSSIPDSSQSEVIEGCAEELQRSLSLGEGQLVRVALFDLGHLKPARLLFIIHHLAVDAITWRFLLEDLKNVYEQLSEGRPVKLPAKTTSFKAWATRLQSYAATDEVLIERDYWLADERKQVKPIPRDYAGGQNLVCSVDTVSMSLSIEETRSLLQDLPQAYHTQINDALLTALARAFADWTGQDRLVVDLEGHGRDAIMEDVDISRTAGWFTTIFPVLLSLSDGPDVVQSLRTIKEQLRAIPNRGIGYGLLRYLSDNKEIVERLRAMPQAEVNFLYLGQFEQASDASSTLVAARESSGYARGPMGKRKHLIEVTGSVHRGQLHANWTYSSAVHARETINRLARKFMNELRAIITSCQTFEAAAFTPSDFADYGWSQAELDDILTKISQSTESA